MRTSAASLFLPEPEHRLLSMVTASREPWRVSAFFMKVSAAFL
jgi:hypothetical protein